MRDKHNNKLLAVWRYKNDVALAAAYTRPEAAKLIGVNPEDLVRVKQVYAAGKPREINL